MFQLSCHRASDCGQCHGTTSSSYYKLATLRLPAISGVHLLDFYDRDNAVCRDTKNSTIYPSPPESAGVLSPCPSSGSSMIAFTTKITQMASASNFVEMFKFPPDTPPLDNWCASRNIPSAEMSCTGSGTVDGR